MALSRRVAERAPRAWALWAAARPSQLALISVVYALGVGIGANGEPFVAGAVGPTPARGGIGALALLPVAVTVHYANEYADRDTDALADRTAFSGGSGALERTGLPPSFLRRALAAGALLSLGALALAARSLPSVAVALLVAVLVLGVAYSLRPVALVRRGLGELCNVALGAFLLPLYGAAVVGRPTPLAGAVVLPFCCVVGCSLLATHWPDRQADAAVGKRTLVVRWSARRIRRAYAVLAVGSALAALALWGSGLLPPLVSLAHLLTAPVLAVGAWRVTRQRSPLPSVSAMVALAAGSTLGWWVTAPAALTGWLP